MDSSHSTGYDFEVIGDMGKDFECAICMLLLREPVELPCAHVFCKVCLEHWQHNPMEKDDSFHCPSCKEIYKREQIVDSKFLDRYVKTSLQVKCKENKSGCQWEGKIIDYTNHYGNCVEYPVNCPNDGCSIITPRKEVCSHTQNECPYQIVNCEYTTVGCKHQHQRRYTCEHQIQCLPDHMNMLLNRINTTSQELLSVKEKLQQTDEKLQQTYENLRQTDERLQETEKRLQITEDKLAITDKKHQETKIILNQTQKELQNTNQDLLQANDRITNVINHDLEIDKLCFQLTRRSTTNLNGKYFDVKIGLESLATMDDLEIPQFNITLNTPDMLSHLSKLLEEKLEKKEKERKTVSYADRFIQVMDMMETNKLYRPTEKEVFVKVDVTNYIWISTCFTDNENFQLLKMKPNVIYFSENVLLYTFYGTGIGIIFSLPGWNRIDTKIFLLNPTKSNPKFLNKCLWCTIDKNTMIKNAVIVKGIKDI